MSITQWPFGPVPPGALPWTVFDIDGPSSYSQIVTGAPPTGGQTVKASDLGFTSIWWAQSMGSDNGQYDCTVYVNTGTGGTGNPRSGATPNVSQPGSQMQLQWVTSTNGAEVSGATNLSSRRLRLIVIGQ